MQSNLSSKNNSDYQNLKSYLANGPIIQCTNVSVEYHVPKRYVNKLKSIFLRFKNQFGGLISADVKVNKIMRFCALKNISFEVYAGDVLGIIGANGAGKSTLLRHLAGIEFPDEGEITVRGKVAPLLNLTAGFRPNLTGIENIYLRGSLLGYRKKQIEQILPEIKAFCGLGEFLYAPYKIYSSGMKARLGFAISIFVSPDILLLDECIGAGDEQFRKSAGSIFDVFKKDNQRAIVVASHNLNLLQAHCNKIIWLDGGKMRAFGKADEVILAYQNQAATEKNSHI